MKKHALEHVVLHEGVIEEDALHEMVTSDLPALAFVGVRGVTPSLDFLDLIQPSSSLRLLILLSPRFITPEGHEKLAQMSARVPGCFVNACCVNRVAPGPARRLELCGDCDSMLHERYPGSLCCFEPFFPVPIKLHAVNVAAFQLFSRAGQGQLA